MDMENSNECWRQEFVVNEMNSFLDKYKDNIDVTRHFGIFSQLVSIADEKNCPVLELGCGTGVISEYLPDNKYVGADLKHIISGCAMRNYPDNLFRVCDIQTDDLKWINEYKVVVMSALIDVLHNPLQILNKVLLNAQKFVIIHRQEITEKGQTNVITNGSYGGFTYHSIISRNDFNEILEINNFSVVKELSCGYGNWENGGSSFLLRKRDSWALDNLDHILNSKLFFGKKDKGFFIEAGAGDGKEQNNTFYFEFYRDFRGLLIEPIPENFRQCVSGRSPNTLYYNCALVSDTYSGETIGIYNTKHCRGLMSVVSESTQLNERLKLQPDNTSELINIEAKSLNKVLESFGNKIPKVIDVLILDVETYELEVLKGIDFNKWNITYLVIEELTHNDSSIREYLKTWYDFVERLTERDCLYKKR